MTFRTEPTAFVDLKVLAWMLYPRDEAKWRALVDSTLAEGLKQILGDSEDALPITKDVGLFLSASPRFDDERRALAAAKNYVRPAKGCGGARLHKGEAAALILLAAFCVQGETGVFVGSGATIHALSSWLGPMQGASKSDLKKSWNEFAPVVHLWAAKRVLEDAGFERFFTGESKDLLIFLSLADSIREKASRHRVKGAKRSQSGILPPGTMIEMTDGNRFASVVRPGLLITMDDTIIADAIAYKGNKGD